MMYRISLSRRRNMKLIYGKTGCEIYQFPPLNARPMNPKSSPARRGSCHCLGFPSGYDMPR